MVVGAALAAGGRCRFGAPGLITVVAEGVPGPVRAPGVRHPEELLGPVACPVLGGALPEQGEAAETLPELGASHCQEDRPLLSLLGLSPPRGEGQACGPGAREQPPCMCGCRGNLSGGGAPAECSAGLSAAQGLSAGWAAVACASAPLCALGAHRIIQGVGLFPAALRARQLSVSVVRASLAGLYFSICTFRSVFSLGS